jgi:hypothetical protein
MVIPKGKKLILNNHGKPFVNQDMILEEDITINLSSNFEQLFGGGNTKLIDVIGAITRDIGGAGAGFSGQFKQLGIQTWRGTDPVSLPSITVGFYVDKRNVDGYSQVVQPISKLRAIPLPEERASGNLIPPGPSVLEALELNKNKNVNIPQYSIQIGKILYLPHIIIKKAEPTYSIETDENGYPIWGKVALDIQSTVTATRQLLALSNNGAGGGGT